MAVGVDGLGRFAGVLLALPVTASAFAADSGPYLGGAAGVSVVGINESDINKIAIDGGFASSQTSIDDTDVGWKAYLGYRFNRYLALEASYIDFGNATFDTVTTGPDADIDAKVEADAWVLDGLLTVPAAHWLTLYGRVGAFHWDAHGTLAAIAGGEGIAGSRHTKGTDPKIGVGAAFRPLEGIPLAIRVEAERYFDVGKEEEIGQADIDFFSVGLSYGF